jgi:hypothetical protein
MRILSVTQMKGKAAIQMWPAEGTMVRKVWDLLQANKGQFVCVYPLIVSSKPKCTAAGHMRRYLTDFWGLDIAYKSGGMWCLVGEWKGKDYVDYLARKYK